MFWSLCRVLAAAACCHCQRKSVLILIPAYARPEMPEMHAIGPSTGELYGCRLLPVVLAAAVPSSVLLFSELYWLLVVYT